LNSYPDFLDVQAQASSVIQSAAAYRTMSASYLHGDRTELIHCELVSDSYFQTLGVAFPLGRQFHAKEDEPAVVISHQFWRSRFNSDPSVIGRAVTMSGNRFTVIGVAPEEFRSPLRILRVDAWFPTQFMSLLSGRSDSLDERGSRGYFMFARLQPGATVEQARSRFQALATQLHRAYPQSWTNIRNEPRQFTVIPESESRLPPGFRLPALAFLALLLSVVLLLLLIACANLASLLLAQAAARAQEMAVRLSLGAGRRRLIRQLLTESLLLAFFGGIAGVVLSLFLTRALMLFRPPMPVPIQLDLVLEPRVLVFSFLISILAGLLMSLAPAFFATRLRPPSGRFPRVTLRGALVVAQTAACVFLLITAGLFVRSLTNAYSLPLGFDTANLALIDIDLQLNNYNQERGKTLYRQMLDAFPEAALANEPLLSLQAQQRTLLTVDGHAPSPGEDMEHYYNSVSPGFFTLMRVRLFAGRDLQAADRNAVLVNRAFAQKFWPGRNAVGRRIARGGGPQPEWREIIGVVEDARFVSFSDPTIPTVFFSFTDFYSSDMTLYVRGSGGAETVRRRLLQIDRNLPILNAISMDQNLGITLLPLRIAGTLIGSFGILALILAAVGVSGILAYAVQQRTREIGVRIAIGAATRDILALVLRQGYRLVTLGAAIGLAAAIALTRLFEFFLYGISPTDPITFVGVVALLALITLIASLTPARRALRIQPTEALRYE
jgi:predicted permease